MAVPSHLFKWQVKLAVKSGIPADAVINDFYASFSTTPSSTDLQAVATALANFYNVTPTGASGTICSRLGDLLDIGTSKNAITAYAVPTTRGLMGAPYSTYSWSLASVGGTTLPEEVACCLSIRANVAGIPEWGPGRTTRPRAQLRNRLYIGPLAVSTITEDGTTHRPSPSSGFRTDLTKAAKDLFNALASAGWIWQTFSPTAWQMSPVVDCWVDDAFDTQRRRGAKAISRTFLTL